MPCFRSLNGYVAAATNPLTGKRSTVWNKNEALQGPHGPVVRELRCGQCSYCRLAHSAEWAQRCLHESKQYLENCFITLTYNEENLPEHGSLDYEAPVLFMKRLRKKFGAEIRSYGCAEYGEKLSRPHYHLCLFNFDFKDKTPWKKSGDHQLYRSKDLEQLWPFGHSSVADFSYETAAYVARYIMKKMKISDKSPKEIKEHYEILNEQTGEIFERMPERPVCVSRRPGIGRTWATQNKAFLRTHDFVIVEGKKMRPAKYYDRIFDIESPQEYEKIKEKRKEKAKIQITKMQEEDEKNYAKTTKNIEYIPRKTRIQTIEKYEELKLKKLIRNYENGK